MRVISLIRSRPRVWDKIKDSEVAWLVDQAWIQRKQHVPGTEDGTPNERTVELGPYACKLSIPVPEVFRQPDRFTLEGTHTLSIACDVEPLESDTLIVRHRNKRYRCHPGKVYERRSQWGEIPIYSLEVAEFQEF